MPGYEITAPDGKKYRVNGPEGYTQEQAYRDLQGQLAAQGQNLGPTRGGDLMSGLVHGAASSVGLAGKAPEGSSGWREAGEAIGGEALPFVAGLTPVGRIGKAVIGAGTGALQPADTMTERLENAGIGAGSALIGKGASDYIYRHRSALNKLANEAIGSAVGYSHLGPWGGLGGLYAGKNIGYLLQNLTGGRGLANFIGWLAQNPGLAAQAGVHLAPYGKEAGQFVGEQLGKPSE